MFAFNVIVKTRLQIETEIIAHVQSAIDTGNFGVSNKEGSLHNL